MWVLKYPNEEDQVGDFRGPNDLVRRYDILETYLNNLGVAVVL